MAEDADNSYLSVSFRRAGKVILEGFAEFIQKPIDPAALIAAVRLLLPAKV
jgi:hypothetical protein